MLFHFCHIDCISSNPMVHFSSVTQLKSTLSLLIFPALTSFCPLRNSVCLYVCLTQCNVSQTKSWRPFGQEPHIFYISVCQPQEAGLSEWLLTNWLGGPSSKLWTNKSDDCPTLKRTLFLNCITINYTYIVLWWYNLIALIKTWTF